MGDGDRNDRIRRRLVERDGPDCHYCGARLSNPATHEGMIERPSRRCPCSCGCEYCSRPISWDVAPGFRYPIIEHRTPRSRGGSDDLDNLVLSCGPCNSQKGVLTEDEFMFLIRTADPLDF